MPSFLEFWKHQRWFNDRKKWFFKQLLLKIFGVLAWNRAWRNQACIFGQSWIWKQRWIIPNIFWRRMWVFKTLKHVTEKNFQKILLYIFRAFDSDCDGSNKSHSFSEKWVGLSKSTKVWSFFCTVWTTKTLMKIFEKMLCQQTLLYTGKAVRPWWRSADLHLRITTTLKLSWLRKLKIFSLNFGPPVWLRSDHSQ